MNIFGIVCDNVIVEALPSPTIWPLASTVEVWFVNATVPLVKTHKTSNCSESANPNNPVSVEPDKIKTDLLGTMSVAWPASVCASNPKIPAPFDNGKFHLLYNSHFGQH